MMNPDKNLDNPKILEALRLIAQNQLPEAEAALQAGLKEATKVRDLETKWLFYANLGWLEKKRGNYKKALSYYQLGEKILPTNPYFKLIIAQIQVEYLKAYEGAHKRLMHLLKLAPDDQPLLHQAHTWLGLIAWHKGQHDKAVERLMMSMGENFKGLSTCANISLKLLEQLLRGSYGLLQCVYFLHKASLFAKFNKEPDYYKVYQLLLSQLKVTRRKK